MEEEISLRELIDIIWRGKWLIILITAFAVVASGILSFFVLDPQYEAKATLMVQDINRRPAAQGNTLEDMLSSLAEYPSLTMDTYKTQITGVSMMRQVVHELNLEDQYGITPEQLKNMIHINVPNNTNLMEVKVQHTNPALAADIVNSVSRQFTQFVTEQSRKQIQKSVTYIEEQLIEEEKHYKQVEEEWKAFLQQPNGVDELEQEISAKLKKLTEFKTELLENQILIDSKLAAYEKSTQQLANMDQKVVTEDSLANHPLLNELSESSESLKDLSSLKIESEQLNQSYVALEGKSHELMIELRELQVKQTSLQKQIESLQNNLDDLQIQLVEKQLEHDRLSQKLESARNSYRAFLNKLNEVRLATSVDVGEKNVMIVAEAEVPENPVGPKKLLNMAIAAVVGGMVSVFVVFIREYWNRQEP
ncbi:MAG: hypothetical protein H0Z33_17040 [Bacillaceae bacterium]|nr:hypothetical protein [Bacillaceae bacterium]